MDTEHHMRTTRIPPARLREWVEFCWLLLINPTFQNSPHKRRAYFEYRLGLIYSDWC